MTADYSSAAILISDKKDCQISIRTHYFTHLFWAYQGIFNNSIGG